MKAIVHGVMGLYGALFKNNRENKSSGPIFGSVRWFILFLLIPYGVVLFAQSPTIVWDSIDWAPVDKRTGLPQIQDESGQEWWFDVAPNRDLNGLLQGYVTTGYATWTDHRMLDCDYAMKLEEKSGTIGLYDTAGNMLWCKAYYHFDFQSVIQTDDGGFLAVGYTPDIQGLMGTRLPYNPGHPAHITNPAPEFTGPIGYKMLAVKVDFQGNIEWNSLYGNVPFTDPDAVVHLSRGRDVVETPTGYRLVGHADIAGNPFRDWGVFVVDIDRQGMWQQGGLFMTAPSTRSLGRAIARQGNEYVVTGQKINLSPISGEAFALHLDDQLNQAWVRTVNQPNAASFDVAFDAQGRVVWPMVINCPAPDCITANGIGDGQVLILDTATGNTIGNPIALGPVRAYDLWLSVAPTPDGGFGVLSTTRQNPQNPPLPGNLQGCSSVRPELWETDALLARYDSQGNRLWEKVFDAPTGPAQPYPMDQKKQECMFGIAWTPERGFILAGKASPNFEDYYLVNCQACAKPPHGMVAWWSMDETSGVLVRDKTGINHGFPDSGSIGTSIPAVPGQVNGAFRFGNDFVEVPHHPSLNFGSGDFSIDLWFDQISIYAGGLVSKNDLNTGYELILAGSTLTLVLEYGPTIQGASVVLNLTPGFNHIAVTVERKKDILFYHNGQLVGSEPVTNATASLNNTEPLYIGREHSVTHDFDGNIDEVELFNRVLTAAEIQAIYHAGPVGKCTDGVHAPWDRRLCLNDDGVVADIEVCNYSGTPQTYELAFATVPATPGTDCTVDGPTRFEDPSNPGTPLTQPVTVTVPAYACRSVPVRIERPVQMNSQWLVGCYDVTLHNIATGNTITDRGSVNDRRDKCTNLIRPVRLPADGVAAIDISLTNTSDRTIDTPFLFEAMSTAGTPPTLRLNDLEPGTPLEGSLSLPPGAETNLSIELSYQAGDYFNYQDLVLFTDEAGTGDWIPLTSVEVRNPTPAETVAITKQPESISLCIGMSTILEVEAIGEGPLFYQWRRNGTPIPQATDATYRVIGITSRTYDCVVTNQFGSVVSRPAVITVD